MRRLSCEEARRRARCAARLLSKDPRVRLVFLFGSAARDSSTSVRDVDLAVLTDLRLTTQELLELGAEVAKHCGGAVDLLSLNGASVALAHEIADSGICLYAETPDLETAFVTGARSRFWDFQPFREVQWRLAGRRLEERLGPQA